MQHPKVTVGWAVVSLERALDNLGDSPAEGRVRRQFHQLVLALERDGHSLFDRQLFFPLGKPATTLPMAVTPSAPRAS